MVSPWDVTPTLPVCAQEAGGLYHKTAHATPTVTTNQQMRALKMISGPPIGLRFVATSVTSHRIYRRLHALLHILPSSSKWRPPCQDMTTLMSVENLVALLAIARGRY